MCLVQSRATSGTAREESLMISHFEPRSGVNSSGIIVSPVATRGNAVTAPPRERRMGVNPVQNSVAGGKARGFRATPRETPGCDCEDPRVGGKTETKEAREERGEVRWAGQGASSPRDESSVQLNEKDQRMWSALKTSLLSGGSAQTDQSIVGLGSGRVTYELTSSGPPIYVGDRYNDTDTDATRIAILNDQPRMKGTRDMEQLDLERSAMDRTMRPHRTASARLFETDQESPSQNTASVRGTNISNQACVRYVTQTASCDNFALIYTAMIFTIRADEAPTELFGKCHEVTHSAMLPNQRRLG